MSAKIFIAIFLLVSFASLGGFLWQLKKIKIHKNTATKKKPKIEKGKERRSDSLELDRKDKKIYKRAKILAKEKRYTQAAQLLESIQLQREAITILEKAGLIHEAAKILMRMGRHNRAGVVYARNKYWERAAESFRYANMPLEVAKCALEFGNLEMAAEQYELAEMYEEAGDIHTKLGNSLKASKLYVKIGNVDSAISHFSKLIASAGDEIPFEVSEVKMMMEWTRQGNFDENISEVVVESPHLVELLLDLLESSFTEVALKVYKKTPEDTGRQLLSQVDYENKTTWQELVKMFLMSEEFSNAGVVFENKTKFKEAAEAFGRGGDLVRAAHCYDRAGLQEKANSIRGKIEQDKRAGVSLPPPPQQKGSFSISSVASENTMNAMKNPEQILADEDQDSSESKTMKPKKLSVDFGGSDSSFSRSKEISKKHVTESSFPTSFRKEMTHLESVNDSYVEMDCFSELNEEESSGFLSKNTFKETDEETISIEIKAVEEKTGYHEPANLQILAAKNKAQYFDVFRKASFMSTLTDREIEQIWDISKTKHFKKDELILNYLQEPVGAYVILSGEISCFRKSSSGEDRHLDIMKAPKTFGELWLLADHPTEVKFIAKRDSVLQLVERKAFTELIDQEGIIARKVYKKFTNRLVKSLLSPNAGGKGKNSESA